MRTPSIPFPAESRPRALMISPVTPDPNGKGIEKRAYWTLSALSQRHRVSLLVVQLGREDAKAPSDALRARCDTIKRIAPPRLQRLDAFALAALGAKRLPIWPGWAEPMLARLSTPPEWRLLTKARVRAAGAAFADIEFDLIHTFRLYTAPVAFAALEGRALEGRTRPRMSLDLDDIESVTRRRFAALHEARGDRQAAAATRRAAELYQALEDDLLPQFDRLVVCSETDRRLLQARMRAAGHEADIGVAPNVVEIPATPAPARDQSPFVFLFVGALGYFPNVDAARFFLTEVAPKLDRLAGPNAWTLDIVGRGGADALPADLARHPRVRRVEEAPTMEPAYARSDAVIAPIRAGGGTRVKILEAFAHMRPVVATTLGAEGIEARDDAEILLADGADAFAARCASLIGAPALRRRLAEAARRLVAARFSPGAMESGLLCADRVEAPAAAAPLQRRAL